VLPTLGREGVDLLAVTGDLVDVPEPLPAALVGSMEADYGLVRDLLAAADVPVMVVPGNHDDAPAMWRALGQGEPIRDIAGLRVIRFCDHEHEGNVPWRAGDEWARFERLVADGNSPPQIHLQHYVIAPPVEDDYPFNYGDAATLKRAMVDAGRAALVLSGHYHPGSELIRDGPVTFSVGPAMVEPPYPWRIYEIDDSGVSIEQRTLV